MSDVESQLKELAQIRAIMDRSTRFLGLSGLAGIGVGVVGLLGAASLWYILAQQGLAAHTMHLHQVPSALWGQLLTLTLAVLGTAIILSYYFTRRLARRQGQAMFSPAARRMLKHLLLPLITGGLFCLLLWREQLYYLMLPTTLLFYGLALISAAKFTHDEVMLYGIGAVVLGLVGAWWPATALVCWALGFGVGNIVYGVYMYKRNAGEGSTQ